MSDVLAIRTIRAEPPFTSGSEIEKGGEIIAVPEYRKTKQTIRAVYYSESYVSNLRLEQKNQGTKASREKKIECRRNECFS